MTSRMMAVRHGLALALVIGSSAPNARAQQPSPPPRPNIVLIITDDVGYGDIGSYGAPDIRTPNIDARAKAGVRLTDFYAMPQCTPTRAALISGRYPQRVRLERALSTAGPSLETGLPVTGRSLPQLLKNHGYATALVGKWHLGFKPEFGPNVHGFDDFFGFLAGYIDFYAHTRGIDGAHDLYENTTAVREDGYMTDLITARAVRFIEQHAGKPFFLEVAYNAAHWPFQPPDRPSKAPDHGRFVQPGDTPPSTLADYIAMLERADRGIGEIVRALDARGIARDTLVIFTNDNGGEWLSRNAPLFHRNDTLWEGGIRVPAIFRWPGRIPGGQVSGQVGVTMDLTATILAAAQVPVPGEAKLEDLDLLPILEGRAPQAERTLFWRIATPGRQQRAVRQGHWKLLRDGDDWLLFDLETDIGERNELALGRQEIVAQLRSLLDAWEKDVDGEAAARSSPPGR